MNNYDASCVSDRLKFYFGPTSAYRMCDLFDESDLFRRDIDCNRNERSTNSSMENRYLSIRDVLLSNEIYDVDGKYLPDEFMRLDDFSESDVAEFTEFIESLSLPSEHDDIETRKSSATSEFFSCRNSDSAAADSTRHESEHSSFEDVSLALEKLSQSCSNLSNASSEYADCQSSVENQCIVSAKFNDSMSYATSFEYSRQTNVDQCCPGESLQTEVVTSVNVSLDVGTSRSSADSRQHGVDGNGRVSPPPSEDSGLFSSLGSMCERRCNKDTGVCGRDTKNSRTEGQLQEDDVTPRCKSWPGGSQENRSRSSSKLRRKTCSANCLSSKRKRITARENGTLTRQSQSDDNELFLSVESLCKRCCSDDCMEAFVRAYKRLKKI